MQQFSEVLLELNNQNPQEVQKILDKLKQQMVEGQHEIFAKKLKENYKGMTKQAIYKQMALSKYALIDYNWNLNLTISSDKMAKSELPTLIMELTLQKLDNSAKRQRIIFEMSKEELEQFVNHLQKVQNQLYV